MTMHDLIRRWLPPRVDDLDTRAEDVGDYDDGDYGRTNYYSWYRWIATIVRPQVVLEIGVRLGYSAWALALPGVAQTFIGLDNESYIRGSNAIAHQTLVKRYHTVVLHTVDTQGLSSLEPSLEGHVPHVIHIDGDHSFAGCLHDLSLAHDVLMPGGVLVVDDASPEKPPGMACNEFRRRYTAYAIMTLDAAFSFMGHQIMVRLD
jgi:predicted O-methyltransferase YrrM